MQAHFDFWFVLLFTFVDQRRNKNRCCPPMGLLNSWRRSHSQLMKVEFKALCHFFLSCFLRREKKGTKSQWPQPPSSLNVNFLSHVDTRRTSKWSPAKLSHGNSDKTSWALSVIVAIAAEQTNGLLGRKWIKNTTSLKLVFAQCDHAHNCDRCSSRICVENWKKIFLLSWNRSTKRDSRYEGDDDENNKWKFNKRLCDLFDIQKREKLCLGDDSELEVVVYDFVTVILNRKTCWTLFNSKERF